MNLIWMTVTAVAFLIQARLGALLLLLAVAYFMLLSKGTIYERLLKVIVYSSAYYTFDIFGGRQRLSMCIVSIAVLCVLLTLNMLGRGGKVSVRSACKLIVSIRNDLRCSSGWGYLQERSTSTIPEPDWRALSFVPEYIVSET